MSVLSRNRHFETAMVQVAVLGELRTNDARAQFYHCYNTKEPRRSWVLKKYSDLLGSLSVILGFD